MKTLDTAKVVVINTSLVELTSEMEKVLENVKLVRVDATNIAIELGSVKCANMVMLGAYAKGSAALSLDDLKKSITRKFAKKPAMVEMNLQALDRGYQLA